MAPEHPPTWHTQRRRALDIGVNAHPLHVGPDQPHHRHPAGEPEHRDHDDEPRTPERRDHQQQHEAGHRQHGVAHGHDDAFSRATTPTGNRHPARYRASGGAGRPPHASAAARSTVAADFAPEGVGAQGVPLTHHRVAGGRAAWRGCRRSRAGPVPRIGTNDPAISPAAIVATPATNVPIAPPRALRPPSPAAVSCSPRRAGDRAARRQRASRFANTTTRNTG